MSEPADGPSAAWPITAVARWRDPGYSAREHRWAALVVVGLVWVNATTFALGGRWSAALVLLTLVVAGWIGWQRVRARPADLELVLWPDRLQIRDVTAQTPATQLVSGQVGALLAAETGLDWRERLLVLTDRTGTEVARVRAGRATVEVADADLASESWWRSTMPMGSSPQSPPTECAVTALLGAWWPRPDLRRSVRGSVRFLRPWKEGDLSAYDRWDRRQTRLNGSLVLGLVLFTSVLAVIGSWSWTLADVIVWLPVLVGVGLVIRAMVR